MSCREARAKMLAVVEDDASCRVALQRLLHWAGFSARLFESVEDFLNSGRQDETGCLIADMRMPGMSGLHLQARLKGEKRDIPIIFITVHRDARMRIQAMREGAVEFLSKPLDHQLLLNKGPCCI